MANLPPEFMGMMEPRPYRNISELVGMLANVLITAERSEDLEIKKRLLHLFDIMVAGLSSFVDKEFYGPGKDAGPVVFPMKPTPVPDDS